MVRKVCIITPGSLASNPRVVKEAEALIDAGFKVHLIYTRHISSLVNHDQAILNDHPEWTSDYLDWSSAKIQPLIIKYLTGAIGRLKYLILKRNLYPDELAPVLINRFYFWQLNKAIASKADLFIAHYPNCIGVAAKAAKLGNTLFGYDAEDYHRGEDLPQPILTIIQKTEDLLLPAAKYITAASILIGAEYQKLYPKVPVITVENMFPLKRQPHFQKILDEGYKFFWFSQTIGPKRGLEEFISILGQTSKKELLLTLLGNVQEDYRFTLINCWKKAGLRPGCLVFINTVADQEIFEIASQHHFGLCLEIPRVLNKDLCMSNKLFTYILSGNCLILSNTRAQKSFSETYPQAGICIELDSTQHAAEKINELLLNADRIRQIRILNYKLGQSKLNFDREKLNFIQHVSGLWE